jgi:arsenical pump membrane protein
MAVIIIIAAVSVAMLTIRPRGLPAWVWPIAGATVMVLAGRETPLLAAQAIGRQWNVLLFIGGLMGLGAVASEAGVFRSVAGTLLGLGRGEKRRLFVWTFLGGAAMTALLSNDATAVILTPIIYDAVSGLGIDPMPYVLAGLFVADTASFGLPFSNPANVVILPHPGIWSYLLHLGVPELAAIAINLGIFLWIFRRQLNGVYAVPVALVEHPKALRVGIGLMCVTVAYIAALIVHYPLGPVAAISALLLLALAAVSPLRVVRRMGWTTLAMLCGLFVLLDAVVRSNAANGAIQALDRHPFDLAVAASSAGAAALLSNAFNNLPVAIAGAYAVAHDPTGHVAYPLIAGVDLGPNLTFGGSIATLLCLDVLRRHGVRVSLRQYLKLGLAVVPACLAVTVLWLWALH